MKSKRAALFDLDGVLVDSEGAYTLFWDGIEHVYPTGIPDYALAIKGTNLGLILSRYPSDEVKADIVERLHAFEASMPFPMMEGAAALLQALKSEGWATAIVTSSDDTKMECLYSAVPQLREAVDCVITGSMVTRSKPSPEGYLMAAEALGCPPERCVVVEDSLQGLRAGRAAGCAIIAVATTLPAAELQAHAPAPELIIDATGALTPEIFNEVQNNFAKSQKTLNFAR